MIIKVKIGICVYDLNTNDFKILKQMFEDGIINTQNIFEIKNFENFEINRDKVIVYDFLKAIPKMFIGLLDIDDIEFYRDHSLDDIVNYLSILKNNHKKDVALEIAKTGRLDWIIMAYYSGYKFDDKSIDMLISSGYIDCLSYFHNNISAINFTKYSLITAITNKHFECFKFIMKHFRYFLDVKLCYLAVEYDELASLKYLIKHNFPVDENTIYHAVKNGSINCLKYLYINYKKYHNYIDMTNIASEYGRLECLKFLIESKNTVIS